MLGYACPTKAAGESRYERVAAAEGERLIRTSRISQAKGPWAGGASWRVRSWGIDADGVILSGLGQGETYRTLT